MVFCFRMSTCDVSSYFYDDNIPETKPRAIEAYNWVAQWMLAAAHDQVCSWSMTFNFQGIQRRFNLTSLRDLQVKYDPKFNVNGRVGKAFILVQDRQVQRILGGMLFDSFPQVADNVFKLADEVVNIMQTSGAQSVSISNRSPLNHLSDNAALEVYPMNTFYYKRPDFNIW